MLSHILDLLHLFFPDVCSGCRQGLLHGEQILCTQCHLVLPRTGFHSLYGNEAERTFYGRVKMEAVAPLWFFNKSSRVQRLIHELKYHGHKPAGLLAGRMLGAELSTAPRFQGIDAIIPVPLHPSKLLSRGFNQSEVFGQGLSDSMGVPMIPDLLKRVSRSGSQTRKRRGGRSKSVEGAFEVEDTQLFPGHFLIADDVITTGATLTACALPLLSLPGVRVSVAAMAYARR
ncbi:MAG: ComF family protein [Bacteroidota bacterium]